MFTPKLPRLVVLALISFALISCPTLSSVALGQSAQRTPSETVREFYKALREKRFKEAWALSIYQPAVEGLKSREYDDLRPDFERVAVAVSEGVPENLEITGEQISGESADVFVRMKDADGKPKVEPVGLIKVGGIWLAPLFAYRTLALMIVSVQNVLTQVPKSCLFTLLIFNPFNACVFECLNIKVGRLNHDRLDRQNPAVHLDQPRMRVQLVLD